MTCVFILLGLVALGFLAGPWALLGLQYRRQRQESARVTDLQNDLARLRAKVEQALGAGGAVTAPERPADLATAAGDPGAGADRRDACRAFRCGRGCRSGHRSSDGRGNGRGRRGDRATRLAAHCAAAGTAVEPATAAAAPDRR